MEIDQNVIDAIRQLAHATRATIKIEKRAEELKAKHAAGGGNLLALLCEVLILEEALSQQDRISAECLKKLDAFVTTLEMDEAERSKA